ncbi:MAG TPA: hypothetical protein VMR98_02820, partial [Candidatus Polarisedimenticolaceae bacterium]|nr:hypothetical protein [Candidatus Polarisedimenticolaceae bacterium]
MADTLGFMDGSQYNQQGQQVQAPQAPLAPLAPITNVAATTAAPSAFNMPSPSPSPIGSLGIDLPQQIPVRTLENPTSALDVNQLIQQNMQKQDALFSQ